MIRAVIGFLKLGLFKLLSINMTNTVKVKFTLEQAIKAQGGSRGIALLFLLPRC
jgi:hypothetical protein